MRAAGTTTESSALSYTRPVVPSSVRAIRIVRRSGSAMRLRSGPANTMASRSWKPSRSCGPRTWIGSCCASAASSALIRRRCRLLPTSCTSAALCHTTLGSIRSTLETLRAHSWRRLPAEVVGEILFIGGDDSHLLRAGEFKESVAAARGLVGFPVGRPGDPESDIDWYATGDWMDVARAQQALEFHHHSWPDMLVEMRDATGWKYYPTRLMAPLARVILKRQSAYRNAPGQYADVWGAIRARLGEPTATSTAEPS